MKPTTVDIYKALKDRLVTTPGFKQFYPTVKQWDLSNVYPSACMVLDGEFAENDESGLPTLWVQSYTLFIYAHKNNFKSKEMTDDMYLLTLKQNVARHLTDPTVNDYFTRLNLDGWVIHAWIKQNEMYTELAEDDSKMMSVITIEVRCAPDLGDAP